MMKRKTFLKKLDEKGYTVEEVADGYDVSDDFGWRAFVSEKVRFGLNTCSLELPNDDFNVFTRYVRTPLDKR